MSFWLAIARDPVRYDTVGARLAAVLAMAAEVRERLSSTELAEMRGRLAHVLDGVDPVRVGAVRAAMATLERELRDAAHALAKLRALKHAVERGG
jgi:uncharacterized protein with HEPN domain